MLKIFKTKSKVSNPSETDKKKLMVKTGGFIAATRHYPAANKEWYNSIYTYNKNSLKLLSVADNIVINLIRSYFNMYSLYLEKKIRAPYIRTWKRRLSSRKFWVSKAELKHTNDNLIINIYVYNRQKKYILRKIKKLQSYRLFIYIKKNLKKNIYDFKKYLNKFEDLHYISNFFKGKIYKNLENLYLTNLLKKSLKKEIYIMHNLQLLALNQLKFKSYYLEPLKIIINKIYKKKIIFNIIKLKNYFLNSDILMQIITNKTRNRKAKILRILKNSIVKIKTPVFQTGLIIREPTKYIGIQNVIIKNNLIPAIKDSKDKDILTSVISKNFKIFDTDNTLNCLKNKAVSGIRLEASGRLTKRIKASRAIFKLKYIGTLKNTDSSYKGLSSVILRGNIKSNTQYTFLKSKNRIGSFGIKGWVSSV